MAGDDTVVILVSLYRETDDAILVGPPAVDGREKMIQDRMKVWLPRGLILHDEELEGSRHEYEIPRWLMEKKDLENYELEAE